MNRLKKAVPRGPQGKPALDAIATPSAPQDELREDEDMARPTLVDAPDERSAPSDPADEEPQAKPPEDAAAAADSKTNDEANTEANEDASEVANDETRDEEVSIEQARLLPRVHLRGLLEALVFASDKPMTSHELAKLASAPLKDVKELMGELKTTYAPRGIVLGEVAGGWLFRTSVQFAPFVRELTSERPVRLSRAQLETLAIAAYRQPITRPEIDEIRGVDSGATLKLLLERELLRILGKKDEPGRPLLYGTTTQFLEFFGLKSLKDLPTLREFAELSDESRRVAEAELGDVLPDAVSAAPAARNVDTSATDSMTKEPPVEPEPDASPPARDTEVDAMPAVDETTITDPERVLGENETAEDEPNERGSA